MEFLFFFSIFQTVKPDIFSFKLLKFSFLFEILSLGKYSVDQLEQINDVLLCLLCLL